MAGCISYLFDYLFVSSIIATYSWNAVDSAGFGDSGVVVMDNFIAERRSSSSSPLSLFSPSLAVGVAASTLLQSMDRVLIQQLICIDFVRSKSFLLLYSNERLLARLHAYSSGVCARHHWNLRMGCSRLSRLRRRRGRPHGQLRQEKLVVVFDDAVALITGANSDFSSVRSSVFNEYDIVCVIGAAFTFFLLLCVFFCWR